MIPVRVLLVAEKLNQLSGILTLLETLASFLREKAKVSLVLNLHFKPLHAPILNDHHYLSDYLLKTVQILVQSTYQTNICLYCLPVYQDSLSVILNITLVLHKRVVLVWHDCERIPKQLCDQLQLKPLSLLVKVALTQIIVFDEDTRLAFGNYKFSSH